MHKRAFDAALRAALKITFSTTLLACGGTVDVDESTPVDVDPGDSGSGASTAASSGSGGTGGEGGVAQPTPIPRPEPRPEPRPREQCEGELSPPVDWWTFDEHTFACCTEALVAAIPPGNIDAWLEQSFEDQATQNCCTQVTAPNMEAFWGNDPLPHPAPDHVIGACCTLQVGTPTCTAWGPPMPPTMDDLDWDAWIAVEGAAVAPLRRVA